MKFYVSATKDLNNFECLGRLSLLLVLNNERINQSHNIATFNYSGLHIITITLQELSTSLVKGSSCLFQLFSIELGFEPRGTWNRIHNFEKKLIMLKGTSSLLCRFLIFLSFGVRTRQNLPWSERHWFVCLFAPESDTCYIGRKRQILARALHTYICIQRNWNLANQFTPPIMDGNVGLTIIFILLSSLIFTANLTVCMLVYLRKSMRTYTNGFVVSLALSDLLIGSVLIPTWLIFPDSSAVLGYVVSITLLSGVFNLTAVTFDRCIAVMKALQYESFMRKNFKRMICSSWLASLSISFIPLIWGTDTSKTCAQDFCHQRTLVVRFVTLLANVHRLL